MQKFLEWCAGYWRENITKLAVILAALFFLIYRVGSIPTGISLSEQSVLGKLQSHKYGPFYVWHNVLYAPYETGLVILRYLHLYNITMIRSLSALFGFLAAVFFFYIIYRWYGTLIAVLSTLIFVDTLWFLQSSRLAGPMSLYSVATLTLILILFVERNERFTNLKTSLSVIASALILYVPGMIWFLAVGLFIKRSRIKEELSEIDGRLRVLLPIIWLILISPLVWSSIHSIRILKNIFGIPVKFSLHGSVQNFYHLPVSLFVRSSLGGIFAIGHTPIFDVFSVVMILLGVYLLIKEKQTKLFLSLLVGIFMGWILFSIGLVPIYIVTTLLAILVAAGLSYMIVTWFTVFPRNPVARAVGTILLCISVAAVMWLHINQFYIAWPKTTTTLSTYSQHP